MPALSGTPAIVICIIMEDTSSLAPRAAVLTTPTGAALPSSAARATASNVLCHECCCLPSNFLCRFNLFARRSFSFDASGQQPGRWFFSVRAVVAGSRQLLIGVSNKVSPQDTESCLRPAEWLGFHCQPYLIKPGEVERVRLSYRTKSNTHGG